MLIKYKAEAAAAAVGLVGAAQKWPLP